MQWKRLGQMSRPLTVVIVLVIVLAVAVLVLAAVRPNVLGLGGETNSSIFDVFSRIGDIVADIDVGTGDGGE